MGMSRIVSFVAIALAASFLVACSGGPANHNASLPVNPARTAHLTATTTPLPPIGPFGVEDNSLGAGGSSPRPTVPWNPASWVGDLYRKHTLATAGPVLQDSGISGGEVTLGQLAIPGSHDSTTYQLNGWASACHTPPGIQKLLGEDMSRRWAQTQHYSLYQQATLGIRDFDLRIYYDGKSIRTCHMLDAASLADAITGSEGLNRFVKEHPSEPIILNLSHFKVEGAEGSAQWSQGIATLARFLHTNVCPLALEKQDQHGLPGEPEYWTLRDPSETTLATFWDEHRNYVVFADNENGLYGELLRNGLFNCVFDSNDDMTGGYAGSNTTVRVGGQDMNTNLWAALIDAYRNNDAFAVVRAREATQQVLINDMATRQKSKLHLTTYIWAYETDQAIDPSAFLDLLGGNGGWEAAKRSWSSIVNADSFKILLNNYRNVGLIQATEEGSVRWISSWTPGAREGNGGTQVQVGLLEHGAGFIRRLDERARKLSTNVNIVEMDAVGATHLTRDGFINPMMALNLRMVW
jgi:hypothetical protein